MEGQKVKLKDIDSLKKIWEKAPKKKKKTTAIKKKKTSPQVVRG